MKRLAVAIALVMALAAAVSAGFEPKDWRFRKEIRIQTGVARYAEVPLDGDVYTNADGSLGDLRIMAGTGEEIPYVLRRWPGGEEEAVVPAEIFNRAVLPGRFTGFELHVAGSGRAHNRIHLGIEKSDFRRRVSVEGSDDRRTWLVISTSTIYGFKSPPAAEQTTVDYPKSLYRYLRVTIHDDGQSPLNIQEIALLFDRVTPPREDRWFSGLVEPSNDGQAKTTTIRLDLSVSKVPLTRLVLGVREPRSFSREVEMDVSGDGQNWSRVGHATITRGAEIAAGAPVEVAFEERRARYVRATILNTDNPPLTISQAAVYGIQRTLLFPVTANQSYRLYFGAAASSPQYDLPTILSQEPAPPQPVAGVLGPLEPNPAYIAPVVHRPWTEEHPVVLWTVLGAVVLVLVFLIVGTARKAGVQP